MSKRRMPAAYEVLSLSSDPLSQRDRESPHALLINANLVGENFLCLFIEYFIGSVPLDCNPESGNLISISIIPIHENQRFIKHGFDTRLKGCSVCSIDQFRFLCESDE